MRTRTALWISVVLVPPLAIGLLWWRRKSFVKTMLGTLPLILWSLIWLLVVLVGLFGLNLEMAGSGFPIFLFDSPQDRAERFDQYHQEQHQKEAAATATIVEATPGSEWPRFRGLAGDGQYSAQPLIGDWPAAGPPCLWRQPIGGGFSSFAIADGLAFTLEQRGEDEAVVGYELSSGREVWAHAWPGHFGKARRHEAGPRATPTWHQGRIYALGAEGELRVLEAATGELVWRHDILQESQATNLDHGLAASPLVVDDMVIVLPGGSGGKSVFAYKLTGELLWQTGDDRQSYTTPMMVTLAGQRQLLVVSAERAMGLTPEDGALLWDFPWVTKYDINAAQPLLIGDDRFLISAEYGHGSALVRITASAQGLTVATVWENRKLRSQFNSAVLVDGHAYGFDGSVLVCLDVATGEEKWRGARYGHGQLLYAGGYLIVLSEKGQLAQVRALPESFTEVVSFAALKGKTWNLPAIGNGILLVRNASEVAAFDLRR